jgi:hypothetical protein
MSRMLEHAPIEPEKGALRRGASVTFPRRFGRLHEPAERVHEPHLLDRATGDVEKLRARDQDRQASRPREWNLSTVPTGTSDGSASRRQRTCAF